MMVIGLTGGIASGKSTISNYLKEMGAVIIDADLLARQVVEPGQRGWHKVISHFGREILNSDGSLARKKLAQIVFSEESKRQALNQIIHPEVIAKTKEMIANYQKEGQAPLIVVDAPLLIETGMDKLVDEVWVINVEREKQMKRLMARDNLSSEDALQRLDSQMSTADKLAYAHRVIENNSNLEETKEQILKHWRQVVMNKHGNTF